MERKQGTMLHNILLITNAVRGLKIFFNEVALLILIGIQLP